jgi:AcrR family transcriptional regulator
MNMTTLEGLSARERLLAAADDLFYREGVNSVGIDRVIAQAGVAKATLYSAFGSKDELIRAYLIRRQEARQKRILEKLERFPTPRERLLGVFEILGESCSQPGFRGCAFLNASVEAHSGSSTESASDAARAWTRSLFVSLSQAAGMRDPEGLAGQLVLLYDGAMVASRMDRNPEAATTARSVALALVDAAMKG